MADATSSGSGSSGHSESRQRIHRRTYESSKPSSMGSAGPSLVQIQPLSGQGLEEAVFLQSNQEDRETAKKAVALVLRATRKRGFRGAVSLCTEVTGLLEQNRRLERIVSLQKNELHRLEGSKRSPNGSYAGSNRSFRRATETKANQIKPVLVHRSTSPLLKEVFVKRANNQTTQTDISSGDAKWGLVKGTSGFSTVKETDTNEKQIQDKMTKAEEKWLKLQAENIQLKNELFNVKNELESLKKTGMLPPVISESPSTVSKTVASPTKHHDQQSKGKNILPVPPTQRQAEPTNQEVELPRILKLDSKPKICNHLQRKKGFRPFSSPVKVAPNLPSQHQPVRPADMYAQCKCAGCLRALSEESVVVLCDQSHTADKKSPKQFEILPSIGDHVVVRSHLTGVVKYIGPVSGEKQSYVGLHLDSPVGNHSGCVDGVQYFSCPPNYGALVPIDDVLCITSPKTYKVKQDIGSSVMCQKSSSSLTHKKAQTF